MLYLKYIINLVKKLGLKTRNLKTNIIKEQIEQIQANKIIKNWIYSLLIIQNVDNLQL